MARVLWVVGVVASVALATARPATADIFVDAVGDAADGPDISAVSVRDEVDGRVTIELCAVATQEATRNLIVFLDTDANGVVYDEPGRAIGITATAGQLLGVAYTASKTPQAVTVPSLSVWPTATGVAVSFLKSELGIGSAFAMWVASLRTGSSEIADKAPENGALWTYRLEAPQVVPVIGRPVTIPSIPNAGKRVVIAFPVRRSDNGDPMTWGTLVCEPRVGGKVLRHSESFVGGIASLSFSVPKTLKGKKLEVRVSIIAAGGTTSRLASFTLR